MKRGRTALTWHQHLIRAAEKLGYKPKRFQQIHKYGDWESFIILRNIYNLAFGRGQSRKVSVLLVPELRKRRSERDPVVLAQQIKDAGNRLADIKAGRVASN